MRLDTVQQSPIVLDLQDAVSPVEGYILIRQRAPHLFPSTRVDGRHALALDFGYVDADAIQCSAPEQDTAHLGSTMANGGRIRKSPSRTPRSRPRTGSAQSMRPAGPLRSDTRVRRWIVFKP